MSQFDDDFDDDWDDFTPSFQDKLFENLEFVENNAFINNNEMDSITSSKAAFSVFLDELLEIPHKVKSNRKQTIVMNDSTNLQQHHKILKDCEKSEKVVEENNQGFDSQEDNIWTDFDAELLSKLESNVQKENNENKSIQTVPTFVGFTTGSGKSIKPPSKDALQKALKSLADDNDQHSSLTTPIISGFTTAGGKNINISEKAKLKAQSILQEDIENSSSSRPEMPEPKKETPLMTGFTTASGKPMNAISEKAKQKAISMFKEMDESEKENRPDSAGLESDINSKKVNKRASNEPLCTEDKYENILNQYGGFRMGRNQIGVKVSETGKRQAISLLANDSAVSPLKSISNLSVPDKKKVDDNTSLKKIEKPQSKIPLLPIRNKRMPALQKQNKPFKSPIVHSNIELTKAAIQNKNINKPKTNSVFDLSIPKNRRQLSSLGKPLQFNKEQLIARNIPISIINMTIHSAKNYVFDGHWGYKQAEKDLIKAGALSVRLASGWIENHYALIIWKFACLIRSYPSEYANYWKSEKVLHQLLYRYEREVNMGQRPILRKILEKDDISAKHMILVISEIINIKSSVNNGSSNKYQLVLTDGWYQVPACIDLRMERAIDRKKLKVGHKLSICGAQIVGNKAAQSPLSITDNSTLLAISTNGCLPAKWDAKLGYQKQKLVMRSISTVFDDGGIITALDIVVCRKFPMFYSEILPGGMVVTRTAKEEEETRHSVDSYDQFNNVKHQRNAFNLPNFKADNKQIYTTHLDKPNHDIKKIEDRAVTGFFRVRVCDAKSAPDQPLATLLISNANELNHMDIIEGKRYRVFFVVPYRPKNKRYPGLDLKTTRMTRWELISLNNLSNAYIPRYLTLCKDIHQQDTSLDFDLAVFIIQTSAPTLEFVNGRKLWHQKLFVSDTSGKICQIDCRLPLNPIPDVKGQVIGLINVRFELHDNKFDITCLKAAEETEVVSKLSSSSEYMQKGILSLRKWITQNPQRVQELTDLVQRIIA